MKTRIGMAAIMTGIVGCMFAVGGVENSLELNDLVASIGVALTSLMLMYLGTLLVKEEI
jgi:high-affinity Fe2+/Pb2+ permease